MPEKFTDRIKSHCEARGIEIPPGFYRHAASRYAVIDLETSPPKLVAKTWFNQEDVVYYLSTLAAEKRVQILDFKENQELVLEGNQRLIRGNAF